ncbi:MAG: beta-ketoacyl-ACP synthase III [Proteobacteria bacterium]|nr:beta-ketoacyl-ACP synthase III [Pseudomonadota bacterium]
MNNAYINDIAVFLPNKPVDNTEIEEVLGMVGEKPSRSRRIILRNNGIKTRYYAIDRETGGYTHTNATLTAEAVRALLKQNGSDLNDIECLSCGTSSPDQITPGHASMVHGELGGHPSEAITAAGICTSGVVALKYAYMATLAGLSKKAVATGSELFSSFMRGKNFEPEMEARINALEDKAILGFEKDFLRWMLSDGAGAVLITPNKNPDRISLKIDWIEYLSFANELPACMYSGAVRGENMALQGWRAAEDPRDILNESYLSIKQDARLLDEYIVPVAVERTLMPLVEKYGLKPDDITWYLPHYSSEYFRDKLYAMMQSRGFHIPYERWFTNLSKVGNVGAASVYLMIEELMYSGKLKKGDKLLCLIPESGRFSMCYMYLTVV